MNRTLGIWLMVISAVSFGTMATFARIAEKDGVNTPTLMFLRFLFSSIIIGAIVAWKRRSLPKGKLLLGIAAMGGVLYVAQSYSYFSALTRIKAGLASLLLYLYPAIVTVLSVIFLGEKLSAVKVGALALALTGSVLAIGRVEGGNSVGVTLGIMSAVFYSLYIVVGAKMMKHADALSASAVLFASAAIVYLPMALFTSFEPPASMAGWGGVVGLALSSTIAIGTFLAALDAIGPVNASTISALEPIVTAGLGALILHEALTSMQLVGGALILAATVILVRFAKPPVEEVEPGI